MERRVLIDDAPVVRRPLADVPAEGVAKHCDLGMGCEGAGVCYAESQGAPERCGRAPVQGDLWEQVERSFTENDIDLVRNSWHLEWVIWDRTRAMSAASGLAPEMLLPDVTRFTPWSRELPPSRGWWLVREKPGAEVSVLWFERVGRGNDGSWHAVRIADEGVGTSLGLHSEIGNIEWCGLAFPPEHYPYLLDAEAENAFAPRRLPRVVLL